MQTNIAGVPDTLNELTVTYANTTANLPDGSGEQYDEPAKRHVYHNDNRSGYQPGYDEDQQAITCFKYRMIKVCPLNGRPF